MRIEVLVEIETGRVWGWNGDTKQTGILKPKEGFEVAIIDSELPPANFGEYFLIGGEIVPLPASEVISPPDIRAEVEVLKIKVSQLEGKVN